MLGIIGIVVVLVMVFGGYLLAGGKMTIIIKALPFEFMMIGGAAAGAFTIANSSGVIKGALKGLGKTFKGGKWKKEDYTDLLCLLFTLVKLMKTKGMVAVEQHIEKPEESEIFSNYPRLLSDHHVVVMVCDNIRMMTMDFTNPHQFEDAFEKQLEKHHEEEHQYAAALQTVADGLPALGIVAAVLGVIKTMASIDEPPEILGKMIGGALVGTFLGVFLSYGFVGPFAARLGQIQEEESRFFNVIRDVLLALLHGNAPQIAVELGRNNIPSHLQPTFYEVEEALDNVPSVAN